ncbi:proteasome assembly chaperone 1 [Cygnus olor]|uniref:proteasome assembly chaperone 1 n=1 Tax=Cygnus olor TaxID=8869 RepID=UPI001ADEB7AB|nr:proteasome assembly chaperone 1 [Cygnus olor]
MRGAVRGRGWGRAAMATFFGEVVAAPSRAGVDDDEEEAAGEALEETPEDREIRRRVEEKREVAVRWALPAGEAAPGADPEPLPCSRFVVAVGHNAAAFLSSFILDPTCWEVVGTVKLWNEWCRTSNTTNVLPTDSFCLFYRLISDPTVLLCQCSCYVAEDQQFQWLEKVFGHIRKEGLQVTILSTCPVADYKTQESTLTLPSPFLKALKTKEFKEQVCCPLLEQPNIVRDLPAAVLSYCQVWQIPAVLYQCYTDVIKLDTVTIEAFKPLLSSETLKNLVKDVSESTKSLKKLLTTNENHNNIYI